MAAMEPKNVHQTPAEHKIPGDYYFLKNFEG